MKCPVCGTENSSDSQSCKRCGRELKSFRGLQFSKEGDGESPSVNNIINTKMDFPLTAFDHREIIKKMKFEYSFGNKDKTDEIQGVFQKVLSSLQNPRINIRHLLDELVKIVHNQMNINQVTLGLKSASDGLYRYEAFAGLTRACENAHRQIAYTYKEFTDAGTYSGWSLSKYTKLFLAEDNPYADGEEETYNRPMMLKKQRKSISDSREGDYLDIHILGNKNELLGWIEISGTKDGKIPDVQTIRWLEIIGIILGIELSRRNIAGSKRRT